MLRNVRIGLLLALLVVFVSGCFGIYAGPPPGQNQKPKVKGYGLGQNADTQVWTEGAAVTHEPFAIRTDTYTTLAQQVNPAVVNIFTSQKLDAGIGMGLFSIPLPNLDLHAQSLGTGFIISKDGFVLTNYHVIQHADEINVFLHETNEVQPIKIVGVDPLTDVALLKITNGQDHSFLPLADSDAIRIGEPVIAVGNPFGLTHSLTAGVISAKNRTLSPGTRRGNFEQYLQTSAQINPGNSGGPLLNLYGEVVGINTAIIAKAQGIGFAIPSNLVKDLMPALVRKGHVERGYFGIAVLDLTPVLAQRFKVKQPTGVLVARIDPEGPAAAAGLKRGDIIVSVDGKPVENALDCGRRIALFSPGKQVRVEVISEGKSQTYTVTTRAL